MERILSDEEKFRKAEEIYNRRRNINVTVPTRDLNRKVSKNESSRFKKMLIQMGVSIFIYFIIYIIQNSNYFFSNDIIKKIEVILTYDINFNEKFKQLSDYIKNNKFFSGLIIPSSQLNNEIKNDDNTLLNSVLLENIVDENAIDENVINENIIDVNIIEDNAIVENIVVENKILENVISESAVIDENNMMENINSQNQTDEEISEAILAIGGGQSSNITTTDEQMRIDAKNIKDNYEIMLPLRGTITSRYGEREIEPKFHTGIDIARNTGSEIISAISGTVILAEEQSSYGKVIKIQNNDLIILYAHCNELLVSVGDKVNIMQKVATVGSTGNSTGPHLHFEIIYCGRYVNPEYVLEFKE